MEHQSESESTSNNENLGRELNQFTIPTAASIQRQAQQRVRDPRLFFSSSYTQQNTPQMPPVATLPVQIFTSQHEASQAAQRGNIVIPTYIAIDRQIFNTNNFVQSIGGRRSRKRNNKKRNIKTKKRYNS